MTGLQNGTPRSRPDESWQRERKASKTCLSDHLIQRRNAEMRGDGSLSKGIGPQQQFLSPTDLAPEEIKAWRIRHFGDKKGSIKACAHYLGTSRFTVHAYERGAWGPRLAVAHRMAALERDPEAREVLEALDRLRRAKGVRR